MLKNWNENDKPGSVIATAKEMASFAKMVFEKDGKHIPILALITVDGGIEIINTKALIDAAGDEWRSAAAWSLRQTAKSQPSFYALIFICEAWSYIAKGEKDHTVKQLQDGEISVSQLKPDDRNEILCVTMTARDKTGIAIVYPILRDGDKVTLGEPHIEEGDAGGRFGNEIWS